AQRGRDPGIGETRELGRAKLRRGERERDDGQIGRVEARQGRLFDLERQLGADLGDAIADVLRRLLEVLLEDELDDQQGEAVEGRRGDAIDPRYRVDGVLERLDELAPHG